VKRPEIVVETWRDLAYNKSSKTRGWKRGEGNLEASTIHFKHATKGKPKKRQGRGIAGAAMKFSSICTPALREEGGKLIPTLKKTPKKLPQGKRRESLGVKTE